MTDAVTGAAPTRRTALPPAARLAALAVAGAAAGAAAKAADESPWPWAADLGTFPAAWVLAVALMTRGAPSPRHAALRAAAFFAGMTLAYYAWAAWVLGFGWSLQLPLWLALSLTAVPLFGVTVWLAARRTGPLPGALLAFAAAVVLARGMTGRLWTAWTGTLPDGVGVRPVQVVADVVVAAVVVGLLPRAGATRRWALVLLVPVLVAVRVLLGLAGR